MLVLRLKLFDLGAKYLQTEHPQTSSNPILRLIHQPYYDSSGGDTGHFSQVQKFNDGIYERIGQNIGSVQCMQRPRSRCNFISQPQGSWIAPPPPPPPPPHLCQPVCIPLAITRWLTCKISQSFARLRCAQIQTGY